MTTISGDTGVDKFEGTTIAGHVIQVANYTTGAMSTGTALIPFDNTIPQITEGTQFMSLAFTPKKATSKLKITVNLSASISIVGVVTVALFQDSIANALATSISHCGVVNGVQQNSFITYISASDINSKTFTVRASCNATGTITVNGQSSSPLFGGSLASSITIEEIAQ